MPDVQLVDLAVIRRYSLAVRQETADAAELLNLLDTDRKAIEKLMAGSRPRRKAPTKKKSPAGSTAKGTAKSGKSSR